jgi:hypothetical protein
LCLKGSSTHHCDAKRQYYSCHLLHNCEVLKVGVATNIANMLPNREFFRNFTSNKKI